MNVIPIKFEALINGYEMIFQVESFKMNSAVVEIHVPMTVALWDEVAPKIRECLVAMNLEVK